jgi:SM-20-related protein
MTVEVQVRLSLQGGHVWEFCCDEDDPIVLGLVSALPGANVDASLPPDGLIQVEAQTGERLFLTRSSLVSVEIIPIEDETSFRGVRRVTATTVPLPGQLAIPAPFVVTRDALSSELHRALIEHALAQEDTSASVSAPPQDGPRELELGALEPSLAKAFEFHLAKSAAALGLSEVPRAYIACHLFSINHAQAVILDKAADVAAYFVYHMHKQPKGFTGGGMRLFDGRVEHGVRRALDTFRDIEIDDNALLMFPGHVVNAGLPVRCASRAFADGLFAVCGVLREGRAGE